MNFVSIEGRVLSAALRLHTAIIEKRNTYPILANVRLTVAGSVFKITGTDLDLEATTDLDPIDAGGDWSMCISARLLADIARVAGPEVVRIERRVSHNNVMDKDGRPGVHDQIARITVGDVTYDLPTLNADGYPDMPGTRGETIERFSNGSFAAMLDKVAWCISTEETRYYLNGVCWQTGPMGKRFAATDGHKLALCRYDTDTSGARVDRIIPRKAVHILRRFAAGADVTAFAVVKANEQGDLAENPSQMDFQFGRTQLRTKLIEGTFPDIDRVLPKPELQQYRFSIGRQAMIDAIDRVNVVRSRNAKGRFYGNAVRIHQDAGRIAVEAKSPDAGTARIVTEAEWPDKAHDFGMNGSYLRQLLSHCQGMVEIAQIDAGMPFTVTDEDDTMTRVIMPMRV